MLYVASRGAQVYVNAAFKSRQTRRQGSLLIALVQIPPREKDVVGRHDDIEHVLVPLRWR